MEIISEAIYRNGAYLRPLDLAYGIRIIKTRTRRGFLQVRMMNGQWHTLAPGDCITDDTGKILHSLAKDAK